MGATALSALPQPPYSVSESPPSFVPGATVREILLLATTSLVLLVAEVLTSNPRILFGRYLWLDELQAKLFASKPSMWESLVALAHSGDFTPPVYHVLARASWGLLGGSAETAFRTLSFVSIWVAVVLIYVLLRRTFAVLPALVAVLAFWSSHPIIEYAFYARPYAPLLAAIAGFCLIYGLDNKRLLVTGLTALIAALVCTLHYFGVFALAAVVLGDTLARREPLPVIIRRCVPAAAGPIALAFCWPFVHAWKAGQTAFADYLPAQTLTSAMTNVLHSWAGAPEATAVLVLAWCISDVTLLIIRVRGCGREKPHSRNIGPLQPVAGLVGLILVPIFVAMFSILAYPAMLIRYMIPGLLGVTVLLAIVASDTPPRILAGTALLLILLGAWNLRLYSAVQMKWQASEDQMMKIGENDELPIVTFSSHEAYLLYAYAPSLRNRLFVADLRENHRSRLFRGMLVEYEFENKWLTVYPDLPKLVNLDQLRHMGKFHLLNPDSWVLAEQENRPLKSFPLQEIAQAFSFEKVGDLYEVGPN